jgi:hypothetical protein
MITTKYKLSLIIFFSLIGACQAPKETNSTTSIFESASSVDAVRNQFSKYGGPKMGGIWHGISRIYIEFFPQ